MRRCNLTPRNMYEECTRARPHHINRRELFSARPPAAARATRFALCGHMTMNATAMSSFMTLRVVPFDARVLLTIFIATIVTLGVFVRQVLPRSLAIIVRVRAMRRALSMVHNFRRVMARFSGRSRAKAWGEY